MSIVSFVVPLWYVTITRELAFSGSLRWRTIAVMRYWASVTRIGTPGRGSSSNRRRWWSHSWRTLEWWWRTMMG